MSYLAALKRCTLFAGFIFGVLCVAGPAHPVHAAVCTFASAGTSDFNTAANWSCGFVPGASSTAIIPVSTSTALSAAVTVAGLTINTGATLTTPGFDLNINDSVTSTGALVVTSANTIRIGNDWNFAGGGSFTAGTGTVMFTTSTASVGTNHDVFATGP